MASTEHARRNAASHIESIRALWIAYRVATCEAELEDYENTDEAGGILSDCDGSEEEVLERVYEYPLSVDLRGGWYPLGDPAAVEPEEYRIILTCGGPSLELRGDVGHRAGPVGHPKVCYADAWQGERRYLTYGEDSEALNWFVGILAALAVYF